MIVPSTNDTTVSTACTMKYAVGDPSADQDWELAQRFLAKVIQMIQDHTPNNSRKTAVPREMRMPLSMQPGSRR